MILPGLISLAFYRRRPTRLQVVLSVAFTVVVSGLLGYWQDYGTPRVWLNVVLAIVGGVALYLAIYAYLVYRYFPRHPVVSPPAPQTPVPPAA